MARARSSGLRKHIRAWDEPADLNPKANRPVLLYSTLFLATVRKRKR